MNKIHVSRLKKLAIHLLVGKLGHKTFDLSTLNSVEGDAKMKKGCGTLGCAVGECPIVFEKHWKFMRDGSVRLRTQKGSSHFDDWAMARRNAEAFFGLESGESAHLFQAACQKPDLYGGKMLGYGQAAREDVGMNIILFLRNKGEI